MNHKDRKNSFKRATDQRKSPRKFILFAEGEKTEKSYFDLLKKTSCKVIPITKPGGGISKCVDFVNASEKAWSSLPKADRDRYDQRWLIFDADGRSDFEAGVKLAREKNFGVAFSNMCIEYWFILHFYDHDGKGIPQLGKSHSDAQIKLLNDYIRKHNKRAKAPIEEYDSQSKTVKDDLMDLLLAVDPVQKKSRIVLAFLRAKEIHEKKKRTGKEFKESVTTIYELLLELGVIEETKEGYGLFRK